MLGHTQAVVDGCVTAGGVQPRGRAQLRRELGLGPGLVLLGSSTWPGEAEALLGALRRSDIHTPRTELAALLRIPPADIAARARAPIERMLEIR